MKFLKTVADFLAGPLTHIINPCIRNSYFPKDWKVARISPIPKVEQPKSEQDYRPVSILPALCKVFERLVARQVMVCIENLSLFNENISAFRRGHSTTHMALLGIRDEIIRSMRRGEVTLMVLADYSKALDTVNFRSIKMHSTGFSKNYVYWVLSYLTCRQQFGQIDGQSSRRLETYFGVPQGGILAPRPPSSTYMQQIFKARLVCRCTTLLHNSKPPELGECVQDVNWTIDRLNKYSLDPNLALNSTRAKWMLLSTRQMKTTYALEELSIDIDCSEKLLERVECTKLLGVHLNQHLSWQEHTTNLPSSCCATLTVFKKLRNFAPFHFRKRLAESLVLSKLDYCNLVYTTQRNSAFGAR